MVESLGLKQVVAAVMMRGSQVLICQRTAEQAFPLQWEFPGGKVETGEEWTAALRRELLEELGIEAVIGPELATVRHEYAEGLAVELHFFSVHEYSGEVENRIFREVRWEERASLNAESFLDAEQCLVRRLKGGELAN